MCTRRVVERDRPLAAGREPFDRGGDRAATAELGRDLFERHGQAGGEAPLAAGHERSSRPAGPAAATASAAGSANARCERGRRRHRPRATPMAQ